MTRRMQRWRGGPSTALLSASFLAFGPTLHLGPHTHTHPAFHCVCYISLQCISAHCNALSVQEVFNSIYTHTHTPCISLWCIAMCVCIVCAVNSALHFCASQWSGMLLFPSINWESNVKCNRCEHWTMQCICTCASQWSAMQVFPCMGEHYCLQ